MAAILDDGVQMGPVINLGAMARIEKLIGAGVSGGASIPVDGRGTSIAGYEQGAFVRPTILADVKPGSEIARTEIFGPVLSLMHVNTIDEAIALANSGEYGNQASLFTSSGPVGANPFCRMLPGEADRFGHDLFFALQELVIERAFRHAAFFDDLIQPCAVKPLIFQESQVVRRICSWLILIAFHSSEFQ